MKKTPLKEGRRAVLKKVTDQEPGMVAPATWEAAVGGPPSKASLGKVSARPYLKNKLKVMAGCGSSGRVLT
jgi:hypothetical protein